jgi:hypothetical protein
MYIYTRTIKRRIKRKKKRELYVDGESTSKARLIIAFIILKANDAYRQAFSETALLSSIQLLCLLFYLCLPIGPILQLTSRITKILHSFYSITNSIRELINCFWTTKGGRESYIQGR